MPKEMEFFIFLLEQYAAHKERSASDILQEWDELNLTDLIYRMYERYHCEAIENAFQDIDELIEESRKSM